MIEKIAIPQDEIFLNDKVLMLHMLDAANETYALYDGHTRLSLDSNRMLLLALIKEIELIGGMASKVSESIRNQYPTIPWRPIIDMRNHLIHGYFDVDIDQVWSTVTQDLPPLIAELQNILMNDSA